MRIGLDVRYISHGVTGGVAAYVRHLAAELPRVGQEHQFFYYADAKAPLELVDVPSNVTVRTLPWRSGLSTIWNDYRIGRWMERDAVHVVHAPGNYGPSVKCPLVVTLHDSINLFPFSEHLRGFGKHPYKVALMMYLSRRTQSSLRRASRIIAVSDDARRDIARRSSYPIDRIVTIHEAADAIFEVIDDDRELMSLRDRFQLSDRFILADGIKNPDAAIDAYRGLPDGLRNSIDLVFFSREAAPRPAVAEALDDPRVRFFSRPSSREIGGLMNLAAVFVFPSFYEGFGIPLVEAMRCGAPIVASTRGSIPEVTGGAALLFALEEPAALVRHLTDILGTPSQAQALRAKSLERARAFSWTRTAERTLDVYADVITKATVNR